MGAVRSVACQVIGPVFFPSFDGSVEQEPAKLGTSLFLKSDACWFLSSAPSTKKDRRRPGILSPDPPPSRARSSASLRCRGERAVFSWAAAPVHEFFLPRCNLQAHFSW